MKKFLSLLLLALTTTLWAAAVDFDYQNVHYSEYRTGKSVYVTGLASSASKNPNVTVITIPGWVTYGGVTYNVEGIDVTAFYQEYYLQNIVIEWGVQKIMASAFSSCTGLKSISIPSSVTSIGSKAFDNTYIDDLYLSWLTPPTIASDAFNGAGQAAWRVWLPTFPAMNATKRLAAFNSNNIFPTWGVNATIAHDIIIDGLPHIITKASTSSSDGEATLVGPYSYYGALTVSATATGVAGDYALTRHRYVGTAVVDSAFTGNTTLTSVTLPASYKTIGAYAFSGAKALVTANVAAQNIRPYAFQNCTSLTTFTMGGETTFGSYCFRNCPALTTVNVSSSVTGFNVDAFQYDNNLTQFVVNANNANFSSDSQGLLYNKAKNTLISCPPKASLSSLPGTLRYIYGQAFHYFKGDKVVVPYGVTDIGNQAFSECPNLKFLKIPSTVTTCSNILLSLPSLQELILGRITPPNGRIFAAGLPSSFTIKVPSRAVDTYKSHSNWNIQGATIDMGGFDVMFYIANNTANTIFASLDASTKRAYITYGWDAYRGNTTQAKTTGTFEIPSTLTYNGVTYTVYAVDDYAFFGATSLQQITLPKGIKEVGKNVWLNNPDSFRCYVPNEEARMYYNAINNSDAGRRWNQVTHGVQQLYTYLRNDNDTIQTYSPQVVDILLPTEPDFHIVTNYNDKNGMLVTEKLKGGSLGVKAASALLVSGMEKGKIYRFDKPVKAYSQEGPLYGCGWNETAIDESKYKVYYFDGKAFQALTTDVAAYRDTHPGEAVLSLYRANVENIDTFRLDIMGTAW